MRLFKKASDGTTVTLQPGVTGGLIVPVCTNQGLHTVSGTIVSATATPYFYKIFTCGTGSSLIDWWTGATSLWQVTTASVGPTPSHYGDILFETGIGNMYIANGTTSTANWKLVTHA
jgi:hypothetical protein